MKASMLSAWVRNLRRSRDKNDSGVFFSSVGDDDVMGHRSSICRDQSLPPPPAASSAAFECHNRGERNSRSIHDCYEIGEIVGTGSFSVVQRAVCRSTGTAWAVKTYNLDKTSCHSVLNEIRILSQLDHKNILCPREYFDDEAGIALIVELLSGSDLLETLTERGSYAEDDCRQITKRLLEALVHCHSKGIVHRDLKLENVVLACDLDPCSVRLVDFGLAGQITNGKSSLTESCGTPAYAAPEVLQRGPSYGTCPDVWAIGVLVFLLLCGAPPFVAFSLKQLLGNIRTGNYRMSDPAWELVSQEAREFVKLLLVVNPEKRPTATEALDHPWLRE